MTKLEIAKKYIKEFYPLAHCGLHNCRNVMGDPMELIYEGDKLQIWICYAYGYFEVFGLSEAEFSTLLAYYYEEIRG